MRDEHRDEQAAAAKVKEKFFGQICAPGIDTHLLVGTVLEYGTWMVPGVFWPKE